MPVVMETPGTYTAPPHKLWTRAECEAMERAGLLELGRYELIAGELVLKMGKNRAHMVTVMLMVAWLHRVYGPMFVMQEPSIDVHPEDNPTSDPEPDVVVLRCSGQELPAKPRPDDLRFVAEVSNTTLSFDMKVKAGLYARAGIAEYWVVDVEGRRVIVHRRPEDGVYRDVAAYGAGESVATLGAPEQSIRVGDLF
jgi:Uma2 family endonuclease